MKSSDDPRDQERYHNFRLLTCLHEDVPGKQRRCGVQFVTAYSRVILGLADIIDEDEVEQTGRRLRQQTVDRRVTRKVLDFMYKLLMYNFNLLWAQNLSPEKGYVIIFWFLKYVCETILNYANYCVYI